MNIVDTHQHLWDLGRFPYSWCAGIPALNRTFALADYLAAAEGAGIVKTLFVECDVDEPHTLDEARHIQNLADENPLIAGIVAGARPERADFSQNLAELLKLPKLRGIRRVLHIVPDEVSQSPLFAENVRLLAAHSLTFDLCVLARQLPIATALVEKCPDVTFVLDHCGVPDIKNQALDPWRDDIRRLSQLPNAACKISGIAAYGDGEKWTPADLRPFVDHVIECFGWDRVLFGTDWPVCNLGGNLRRWLEAALLLTGDAPESTRNRFFSQNAQRLYRL